MNKPFDACSSHVSDPAVALLDALSDYLGDDTITAARP
jgi:hypothetical protein